MKRHIAAAVAATHLIWGFLLVERNPATALIFLAFGIAATVATLAWYAEYERGEAHD